MKIQMGDILGKMVILKFHQETVRDFAVWDITSEEFVAVVTGIEERLGLWLRNPRFKIKLTRDKEGNLISQENQELEEFEADVFIPWQYIKGILHVRDDRFVYEKSKEKKIGYYTYKNKEI